jgi:F-type H+-transporting ATPase subunit b
VKSFVHSLAVAATLLCCAGLASAQDDDSATAPAASNGDTDGTAPVRARRARPAAAKRIAAARRRQALAREEAAEAARTVHIPTVLPTAKAEQAAADKPSATDSGVDSSPAPLDVLPGIGAINEPTTPGHESHETALGESGKEGTLAGGPHDEGHAEGHGEQHGEHTGFSGKTFALQLLNFGVLLFILIWFGGRAFNKSLRARHEQLKGDIGEAARLRDEAAKKFQAQEQRLADLEKEIATLRASLRQDAEREQARMIEGAQERAKRIQEDMRFQLSQQVKEAELLLRAEVASASVKLAEELVRKSVNAEDERRLAREFVAGFAGVDSPVGPEGGTVG